MDQSSRFWKYYSTGKYKGFRKVREYGSKLHGMTQLVFSNGTKKLTALGAFKEDALEKTFNEIDEFHSEKKSHSYQQ